MTTKINLNLFDLTDEQIQASKSMYNGKIIKCLVAPYHTYAQLEKIVPFTKNTFLFPERDASIQQLQKIVSIIASSPSTDEYRIITTNQNIIMDMIDSSVRVLTEDGDVVDCPCSTFMANIHDIRYSLLENKQFQKTATSTDTTYSHDKINAIIERTEVASITRHDHAILINDINLIGEDVIRNALLNQANRMNII